jgi:hypothetical protein
MAQMTYLTQSLILHGSKCWLKNILMAQKDNKLLVAKKFDTTWLKLLVGKKGYITWLNTMFDTTWFKLVVITMAQFNGKHLV